ncbi:MAG: hypothetical protein HGN29_08040 [Asgard group archaeon]|nr:hypothetical protein [Asgard group archaeon]
MGRTIFVNYLTRKDILSTLTSTDKKITKLSDEEIINRLINEIHQKKITVSKIRKVWSKSMNKLFFNEYQRLFSFTPTKKFDTSTKLKNEFLKKGKKIAQDFEVQFSNIYMTKLSSKPLHYLCAMSFEQSSEFKKFLFIPLEKQMILSIFPEMGVATFWPMEKDTKLKFITKVLSAIAENVEEVKVNALLLRKYATKETINKLGISTPQEIAGFAGLDVIEFRGPNVMLGLSGLKRRHDANVDVITRVGPFTEIESETLSLICSKGAQIRKYEGLVSIFNVLKTG